jgi:hypothetical protein
LSGTLRVFREKIQSTNDKLAVDVQLLPKLMVRWFLTSPFSVFVVPILKGFSALRLSS